MDDDLDRELQTHLDLEAEEQREAGLPADQARYAALKTLGNQAHIREDVRALSSLAVFEDLLQDVRHGLRMLRKNPTFMIIAAGTLALGIAANTAMFSVVDAVLLQPLSYAQADRLAMVWEDVNLPTYKNHHNASAPGNFHDWDTQNRVFSEMAAVGSRSWNLTGSGEPMRVDGEAVSAGLFRVLQVVPILGRAFTSDDDTPAGASIALLAHGFWVDRFGATQRSSARPFG